MTTISTFMGVFLQTEAISDNWIIVLLVGAFGGCLTYIKVQHSSRVADLKEQLTHEQTQRQKTIEDLKDIQSQLLELFKNLRRNES